MYICAKSRQPLHQERGGSHAICVEIAVDDDALAPLDCCPDALHCLTHPLHGERIAELGGWMQERRNIGRIGQTAVVEHLDENRVQVSE